MNEKKKTIKDVLDGLLSKDSVEALAAIDSAETIRILLGHVASSIEAAAERERIELREDEAKMLLREYAAAPDESLTPSAQELKRELLRLAPAPGNAAAMREALDKAECVMLVAARFATDDAFSDADARENLRDVDWDGALEEIRAALAAPARNCDTVRDGREALGWCRESVAVERDAAYDRGMRDAIRWLLAPAEKGGAS